MDGTSDFLSETDKKGLRCLIKICLIIKNSLLFLCHCFERVVEVELLKVI